MKYIVRIIKEELDSIARFFEKRSFRSVSHYAMHTH